MKVYRAFSFTGAGLVVFREQKVIHFVALYHVAQPDAQPRVNLRRVIPVDLLLIERQCYEVPELIGQPDFKRLIDRPLDAVGARPLFSRLFIQGNRDVPVFKRGVNCLSFYKFVSHFASLRVVFF